MTLLALHMIIVCIMWVAILLEISSSENLFKENKGKTLLFWFGLFSVQGILYAIGLQFGWAMFYAVLATIQLYLYRMLKSI